MIIPDEKHPYLPSQDNSWRRSGTSLSDGGVGWSRDRSGKLKNVQEPSSNSNVRRRLGEDDDELDGDLPPEYDSMMDSPIDLTSPVGAPSSILSSSDSTTVASPTQDCVPPLTIGHSTQAVNYVSINHPLQSIECVYTIDPGIEVPMYRKPFRREDGHGHHGTERSKHSCGWKRRNLKLRTKAGSIDADVTILCRPSVEPKGPVRIDVSAVLGTINLRLRMSPADAPKRPPIHLRAITGTGTVQLQLPRSFHGFLNVHTTAGLGSCSLAPDLIGAVQWLEEGMRTKRYFVGNPQGKEANEGKWVGDKVKVETVIGSVEVAYVDE